MLNVKAPSRASPLPHWFRGVLRAESQTQKSRARITPVHGFFYCVLLVNSVGQAFGHNQLDNFLGSDFDGSASRRVTASAGRTLGHFQFADTRQSDFAAVFQLIGNDLAQLVQSVTRGGFWGVDSFSDVGDQLVFSKSHVVFLPYQIHMVCSVQCQPSSPIVWIRHPRPITTGSGL